MECKECFFLSPPSRVIWTLDHMKVRHSSSAEQSNLGVDVSIHVELYAISGRNPPQAFLKWIAGVFFQESYITSSVVRPWPYKYIVCDCWLLFVLDLIECVDVVRPRVFFDLQACNVAQLKRETRALFVLQSLERQRYSIFGVTQTDVSASYIVPFDD